MRPMQQIYKIPWDPIFKSAAIGMALVDFEGRLVGVNPALEKLLGYKEKEMLGRNPVEFLHGDDATLCFDLFQELVLGVTSEFETEVCWRGKDGDPVWTNLTGAIVVKGRCKPTCVVLTVQDSSPYMELQSEMEQAMTQSRNDQARLRDILETLPSGLLIIDPNGRISMANRRSEELLGYDRRELCGKMVEILLPDRFQLAHARQRKTFHSTPGARMVGPDGNIFAKRKDGTEVPVEVHLSPVSWQNEGYVICAIQDRSERKLMQAQLEQAIRYDLLTGLPNRLLLQERLDQALLAAQHGGHRVGLLYLDLNRFKHLNDSFGHTMGDQLLQWVASRLNGCIPFCNTIARFSGDKFTIVLDNLGDLDELSEIAHQILASLAPPFQIEDHEIFLSASLGISVYPEDGASASALLKNAEAAMYRAKEEGGGCQFYTQTINASAREQLQMECALHRALEREEFVLHFQPQINPFTGEVPGAEALLRWQHPEKGLLGPPEFIPLLERTGLILPVGQWVLLEACRKVKLWRRSFQPDLRIAVNISPLQFLDPGFVEFVEEALAKTQLDPAALELEITEGALMKDTDASTRTLSRLTKLGLKISIDDFGTGYSSLYYLKHLPVHAVKLDQNFVTGIPGNRDDVAISAAIFALAESLGLDVTAEGVETREQLDMLRSWHCHMVQGFLFAPAMPDQEFFAWLRKEGRLFKTFCPRSAKPVSRKFMVYPGSEDML